MTKYKANPGILLVKICDQYLLVSAREARKTSPYINQINETGAFLWNLLQTEKSRDEILNAVTEEYDIDQPDQLNETINAYIDDLLSMHYVSEVF